MTEAHRVSIEEIAQASEKYLEEEIAVKGFVEHAKQYARFGFLVLRSGLLRLQCVVNVGEHITEKVFDEIYSIPLESYVSVEGTLKKAAKPIKNCSVTDYEIHVARINVISKARPLPFDIRDINMCDKGIPSVSYNKRLDHRVLDLRGVLSQSIFRVVDQIMFSFRTFLRSEGFTEIKTPKLIGSASEGGANLFEVNFFKKKAYLAQSPQLYKQMAIIGNLRRVYEIGHVYRAEESNTNRYLSEFVGMDLEMESDNYIETIHFIHRLLYCMIVDLWKNNTADIENIRKHSPFSDIRLKQKPLILTHRECVDILRKHGEKIEYSDDFSRNMEKKLGDIIAQEKEVDLFVVRDYPMCNRPFYTEASDDPFYSKSYDFILRGEEILSGAQRISDYEKLCSSAEKNGIDLKSIDGYLNSFKYGVPPHAGCGIGLERLVKALFGYSDIRYFNLFPREPNRLYP